MEQLNPVLVQQLRGMAKQGLTPSRMLREIVTELAPSVPHKLTLIKYLQEAFCLSLQEASPVAGWAPDATGELSDARLDEFVMPEIAKRRCEWESLVAA